MTVTKSSKGRTGLVRPPLTPCLSLQLRLKKKAVKKQKQTGTNPTGTAEWKEKKSWRGRTCCAAGRRWLLAWRGRIVANSSVCAGGKGADSGRPFKVFFSPFLHSCSSGAPWRGRVPPHFFSTKEWLRIGEAKTPGPPTLDRPSGGQSYARGNIK
eukprot:1001836-Amphidinium_carterae.1